MDWKINDLLKKTKKPFQQNYWKITTTSFLLILMSAGVSYTSLIGSVNQIPELIRSVISKEFSSEAQFDMRMFAVLLTMLGGMLFLSLLVKALLDIFLNNPMEVGADKMMIGAIESEQPVMLASLAFAYDADYLNTVRVMFLKQLKRDLWYLVLIVPGVIKHYEYFAIPYLLADNPYQKSDELFKKSKALMDGYKMKAFLLDLYFIPWELLGIVTMGIANVFYVAPKKNLARAAMYLKIKELKESEEV